MEDLRNAGRRQYLKILHAVSREKEMKVTVAVCEARKQCILSPI